MSVPETVSRMPRFFTVLALALIAALALPVAPGLAQDPEPAAGDGSDAPLGFEVGDAVVFRNLAIYPLIGPEGIEDDTEYITLDEGVDAELVTVEEIGGEAGQNRMNGAQLNRIPRQEMNNAPQRAEPQVQELENPNNEPANDANDADEQQQDEADEFARLRALVENLDENADASLDAIMLEVIRLKIAAIEQERMRLQPQARDIRPDMDRLAAEEARLRAMAEQIVAAMNGIDPGVIERMREEAQQAETEPQQIQPQMEQQLEQMQQQMRGGSATVNSLQVTNKSDKPLFLMAGELVLGGQQDRIVAVDTIVPAGESMAVRVFCVEHGRWSGAARFGSGNAVVHSGLRAVAQSSKSQQAVWDEVEKANGKLGTDAGNDTGTYRHNLTNEQITEQTAAYIGHFQQHFQLGDRMVGVAVAIRGEVKLIDRFGSPAVFRALWPKLLKSHVLAAILEANDFAEANEDENFDPEAEVPAPAGDAVIAFYRDAISAAREADDNGQSIVDAEKLDNERVTGFIARRAAEGDEPDASRELLHENIYRK